MKHMLKQPEKLELDESENSLDLTIKNTPMFQYGSHSNRINSGTSNTPKFQCFRFFGYLCTIMCVFSLTGCQKPVVEPPAPFTPIAINGPLARVNIIEHSNLSETITNNDRLKELAKRDFLAPQPYRKVMRVYARDPQGSTKSIITSYYENGQIQQYLECLNGRACGLYLEWYSSGVKKVQATVLAGQADLDENALLSWSFDGECTTWDEQGSIYAIFRYQRGVLNGLSETFYETGERKSETPYENGVKQGLEIYFDKDGTILQTVSFKEDNRHGPAKGYLNKDILLWSEEYNDNLLSKAEYYSKDGSMLSSIIDGNGIRTTFSDGILESQEEIKQGRPDGWIHVYDNNGQLERKYEVHNGQKDGQEVRYYVDKQLPRISMQWRDGYIHGSMKTWYDTGVLESQKEMSQNMKNGIAMSWYKDSSIMLVEEYVNDKLIRGQYLRKGESEPVSVIEKGSGIATLFDASGDQIEKIRYIEGKPQIEEG